MAKELEYATTLKELQAVAKHYNIKFSGLKKSALKQRLTRLGVCYNPQTNLTKNCEGTKPKKSLKSRKSPSKSPSKSPRKSSRKSSRRSPSRSARKSSRRSPRKQTAYNMFISKHTKGGKMTLSEAAELWQQSKH